MDPPYRTPKDSYGGACGYGASCGMPKCSCDVKYPMVYSMVWILLSYAKGFLWRILWCPYAIMEHPVILQNVLLVWSILWYAKVFWCDVKYPMVYSMVWILISYAKGFLWRILWCPYAM
ncbi:hypothetical protein CEXT_19721 [Caerostris extrusa]|uniref:Uncharacterized protein n=1 Tax=Caerostris extrusa TaxID=172846 RepID=A0AAV4TLX5_CAEEX|nr:hypothetical protein CEXT_19721 [Caerostris extrusa]